MWTLLIAAYAFGLLALLLAAGCVALFVKDHRRATRALTTLKIIIAATLGSGGVFAILIRLRETGLL